MGFVRRRPQRHRADGGGHTRSRPRARSAAPAARRRLRRPAPESAASWRARRSAPWPASRSRPAQRRACIAIASRQRGRIGAEEIGEPQPPHQQDGAEHAVLVPAPARGRRRARARQSGRPMRFSRLRQRDVLHQRDVGKAAGRVERLARDEHRLVAGGDAGDARTPVHHAGDEPAAAGCGPSICTSKRPHCRGRVAQARRAPAASASGGSRVSACRNSSTSPRGRGGAGFICARAAARRRDAPGRRSGRARCTVRVAAAAVDHDHLDAARAERRQRVERAGDACRLRRAPA